MHEVWQMVRFCFALKEYELIGLHCGKGPAIGSGSMRCGRWVHNSDTKLSMNLWAALWHKVEHELVGLGA
jgi:hypothetical protein